jgi:uncharacterized protein YeaO (DUF488 family)
MTISIKRVYEEPNPDDGIKEWGQVLHSRIRPNITINGNADSIYA